MVDNCLTTDDYDYICLIIFMEYCVTIKIVNMPQKVGIDVCWLTPLLPMQKERDVH